PVASAPPPDVEAPPCPPVELAELERRPAADTRVIALSEIFPREETRVAGSRVAVVDLGRLPFPRHPRSRDPLGRLGSGLGWEELDARWVEGQLSAGVVASFQAWFAERGAVSESQRRAYLLGRRVNLLRAVPAGDGGRALACAASAAARAADEVTAH